jgi:hypothetical protein
MERKSNDNCFGMLSAARPSEIVEISSRTPSFKQKAEMKNKKPGTTHLGATAIQKRPKEAGMRKIIPYLVALVFTLGFGAGVATAQSPHFINADFDVNSAGATRL